MQYRRWMAAIATSGSLLAAAAGAEAQAPTARNAGEFEAYAARVSTDETRFRLQVGAALATGNTRSFTGNFAGRFLLRRGNSQLTIDGAINYGRAAVAAVDPATMTRRFGPDQTTAENYLLRARFDQFFLENNSIYFAALAFRDQPSGFNSRLSLQVGYLRNFINVPARRRFWGEIGVDGTYENLNTTMAVMGANCTTTAGAVDCYRYLPFARAFLGFEEHATASLDLTAGLEGLMSLLNPADLRLNGTIGLASKIGDDFSLALTLTARYVNLPINGRDSLDTVTLVSVIYQRAFETAPPPAPVAAGGAR